MKHIIFFLPESSINDATEYYVELIKKAFLDKNFEVLIFKKNNFEIKKSDFVVVISCKAFLKVYSRNRKANIIMWFQGLLPEENRMLLGTGFLQSVKYRIYNMMEKVTVKNSYFNFFVSERMQIHYHEKYGYDKQNFMVMPCYNKALSEMYFLDNKKSKSSFVYAGGIYPWQCFEQTVGIYKEIESKISSAFFTVLTNQKEEAKRLLTEANIKNYKILYVPLKDLDKELSKHKYGFLLRENNIINNCATPTKMNTYLSVGLVPIHTDSIFSFNDNLNLGEYEIKTSLKLNKTEIAKKIVLHDARTLNYHQYYELCKHNFEKFYDDNYYAEKIKTELIANM